VKAQQPTQIMGILNVTPDSFSDGGRYTTVDAAVTHAVAMIEQGASIVDVGGESTRPGAAAVDAKTERKRIVPVVRDLVARGIPVSIDTRRARVALAAVEAGAQLINDVSGGLSDPEMARVVAETGVLYAVMHWREGGADATPDYRNVVSEVRRELKGRIAHLIVEGVKPEQIIVDPGIGFGKTPEQNWQLLGHLPQIASLGHGVLVGASRKRFLGALLPDIHADASVGDTRTDTDISQRDAPTAVISALAARSGAWAVRVHDVASSRLALDVAEHWRIGAAT
jgi:dihydropteroate synthase